MAQRKVASPNLMEFDDDSPRVPPPSMVTTTVASAGSVTGDSLLYFSDLRLHDAPAPEPAPIEPESVVATEATAVVEEQLPEPERLALHFFVSCTGIDGSLVASSSARTAQTLVRGALNMFSQNTGAKAKSPRSKPATDVNVEMRVSRELSIKSVAPGDDLLPTPPNALGSESYWSERKKSRNPQFSVGFSVRCQTPAAFDRHVQIMVMIPDEGQNSNKNSQVFGYAQTSFQEMYTIATSGNYQQKMTLPVHSTVFEGATVVIRFVNVQPQKHPLFTDQNNAFRMFLFYPLMREEQEQVQAAAAKLAIEEAAEVDFSVKIPLQLMTVCHFELNQMHEEWKARYNYNRKKSRHFEDDSEALSFGHDVYRVQVICARNLLVGSSSGNGGASDSVFAGTARPSTFSIAGRGGIMNRLKTQAGKWGGPGNGGGSGGGSGGDLPSGRSETSGAVNPFVVVKYSDGTSGPQESVVGKTNTEYDTGNPVWSANKHAAKCQHGKPNTKMFVSASLPSRVDVSDVNSLKQFLFYRPSVLQNEGNELNGWLRFEVFNESYAYMSGVENELIGEVLLPLQSVREAMTVEQKVVGDERDGGSRQTVTSVTLVDWFDVRSPTTDEIYGQIQLRLNILLANPVASSEDAGEDESVQHSDDASFASEPRTQRLAADCAPPSTSNPLENEMPLEFLYPHVMNLQQQISGVTDMIRLSESLLAQKKTFKSSLDKKRADVQSIPTNLHVSYFRIYRNFGSLANQASNSVPATPGVNHQASTEDLLDLGFSNAALPATTAAPALSPITRANLSLQQRAMLPETHATITCGAPTAHAMGLSEYGLREMELEIHRLQGILDKCTPRIMTSSVNENTFVAEDSADFVFGSIQDETDDSEDDRVADVDTSPFDAATAVVVASDRDSGAAKKTAPKKPSTMAARALAGAKAAKKRLPAKKSSSKPKDLPTPEDGSTKSTEMKYPPLRTEAEDGIDPTTSINYAVRVLCRLEMLRAEYYLRKSVAVSQSVSGLVACFITELDLCLQEQNTKVMEQMAKVGFLIGWESLISSHGKELRMLSDAWVAIKCLETFAFQLFESNVPGVVLEKREHVGYTIRVPVPSEQFASVPESLRQGELITVTSVLFTQGINEMQSLANMVGHSGVSIQNKINSTSFRSIVEYYNRFTSCGVALNSETSVGSHPDEILRNLRVSVEGENSSSKNTCILLHASDAVRSLNGGRVTYCKSGKDRTAMSATLEQARLVVQRKRHVLEEIESGSSTEYGPLEEVKNVANIMREFGVRMEIAKKNVGRYKYSFNAIQRKLLPEIYRPPVGTIQDIVTSVTARDS
ncbi:hypothetical protein Gpo141_00010808 [Globisporangium polare]